MDSHLPRSLRRLLVMCGFAAANHHLIVQAQTIKETLPLLIVDEECRHESELIISTLLDNIELTSPDYDPMSNIVRQLAQLNEKSRAL
ncbi:MAG: hypothetical protein ACRCZ6_17635 [Kluyvera sp.]|uniref:hypothetical protein n=1 Tax=Kluyvera sp. TaxID=1538228 RepID=UPI003F2EBAFD